MESTAAINAYRSVPETTSPPRVIRRAAVVAPNDRVHVADKVTLSPEARSESAGGTLSSPFDVEPEASTSSEDGLFELTPEEEKQVQELVKRDREVRAHEQAHKAASGHLPTLGPIYEYQTGPDNRRYAVGGEVQISIPEGRTPEEEIRNAEAAIRAALAPAEPSPQDRRVAAAAAARAAQARAEQAAERDDPEAGNAKSAVEASVHRRALAAYEQPKS